ncbi:hypothetical protein PhCBS80983_g03142 [Powellomyces hirtus]|uniref:AB hydrolase-1 domain-containing protein n=1 Tax=Powellomyces hirtus TaxID=109895 RepID=A0A507E5A5_9FUNG|nr:hypothetical protein PhCBS80983_g03142 [Powellomyces hirtus]
MGASPTPPAEANEPALVRTRDHQRHVPPKSIFYRFWQLVILLLRAVTPVSYIYMIGLILHFHSHSVPSLAYLTAKSTRLASFATFTIWMFAETLWFPYYLITIKRLQARQPPYHATTDLPSRIKLVMRCWETLSLAAGADAAEEAKEEAKSLADETQEDQKAPMSVLASVEAYADLGAQRDDEALMDASNPSSYIRKVISGWFLGAEFTTIRRQNMRAWVAWAFTDQDVNLLDEDHSSQTDALLALLESLMNWTFPPGHNENIKCIRLTLDPVQAAHRPLIYYLVCKCVNAASHVGLRILGYKQRTLDPMDVAGSGTLTYLYRAPTQPTPPNALPIVFIHGIGVGFAAYIPFIALLPRNVPVYLLEWPHVAMQLEEEVPTIPDTLAFITGMLNRDNHAKATFVAHSLGTLATSWMLNSPLHRSRVGSVVLLDPVNFMLCDPTIAYNFLYRPPTTVLELLMHYFVSREMYISNCLSRHFHWSKNVLFYQDLPSVSHPDLKNVVILSEEDGIVPSPRVRAYLEGKNYENSNYASSVHLEYHEGRNHGEMLLRKYLLLPTIKQIAEACGSIPPSSRLRSPSSSPTPNLHSLTPPPTPPKQRSPYRRVSQKQSKSKGPSWTLSQVPASSDGTGKPRVMLIPGRSKTSTWRTAVA